MSAAYRPRHRGKRNRKRDREDRWRIRQGQSIVPWLAVSGWHRGALR